MERGIMNEKTVIKKEHHALAKLASSGEDAEMRPQLGSVQFKDGKATATDSYVLGQIPAETGEECLIESYKFEWMKEVPGDWIVDKGLCLTPTGDGDSIRQERIEESYPDHEKLWPKEAAFEITVGVRHLRRIVEFLDETCHAVHIRFGGPAQPIEFVGLKTNRNTAKNNKANGTKAMLMPFRERSVDQTKDSQ